ncbi:aryl hydrocarbon receptor nuclear translocator-like protein 2 isoform X2 [Clupea harengus]|uniref:Aryl hydrocarbon receptor nuclear translocator-like protein 2 isoform X2 n=1 Tax=Clupea harengus TaxID=7950 RepID=A0A6P3VSB6_CLUHA|nr:aryl hydrocarbon receptor nuclear translocator-like protein 2 isoform X2 [Clupea harengus]
MSAGKVAANSVEGAPEEHTGKARSSSKASSRIPVSLPRIMTRVSSCSVWSEPAAPSSSSSSSSISCMDLSRKRKGKGRSLGGIISGHPMHQVPLSSNGSLDAEMLSEPDRSEGEDQQSKMRCFREPHSQIEKRRRDKMNILIEELSAMVPACNPLARKLDKLTVLRMAVQHLKSLKGTTSSFSEAHPKPSFLPEDELKQLVLRAADGFLFVVSCDRGKIIFVSESMSKTLHYSRMELIGQSLFDYVHPKDVSKVKEQLSASELYPRERLIDTKTGVQVPSDVPSGNYISTGARRSFFCRMKQSRAAWRSGKKVPQLSTSKKKESQRYCTVHCTGYMRSWSTHQLDTESEVDMERESSHLPCLVAMGRVHSGPLPREEASEVTVRPTEFVTRYAVDGKFTFVDQRATTIIGYLPQELLGTSCYEYFHQEDLAHLAESHRKVLRSKEKIETNRYKFKTKQGSFVTLQSQWFSFINPWTKEMEFIVSTSKVVSGCGEKGEKAVEPSDFRTTQASAEEVKHFSPVIPGISSGSGTMIYTGSIGTQIANELLDFNSRMNSPSSGAPSPFCLLPEKSPVVPSQPSGPVPNTEHDGRQPGKSGLEPSQGPSGAAFLGGEASTSAGEIAELDLDTVVGPSGLGLSSDEAAMAVIMSILETDTNLSGAMDFDELQWTL